MKQIDSKDWLNSLFKILDNKLESKLEVYVIGGANLIAQGIHERATFDIDVIDPPVFSEKLLDLIETIGDEIGHIKKWINTAPSSDAPFLNEGWKGRSALFFTGSKLKVWMLHRQDIMCMKLAAALDRQGPDIDDLLALNPSHEEWEVARQWARNYDGNPDWPKAIDELVESLKKEQYDS